MELHSHTSRPGWGATLPGTPSPLLCLPHSHPIFYDSPRASASPGSPPREALAQLGWVAPGPQHPPWLHRPPGIMMVCSLLTPQWAAGLWRAETSSGSLLSPGHPVVLRKCPRTKHRRSELCSPPRSVQIMWFDPKCTYPIHFYQQNQSPKEKHAQKCRHGTPSLGLLGQKSLVFMSCLVAHRAVTGVCSANPIVTASFAKWERRPRATGPQRVLGAEPGLGSGAGTSPACLLVLPSTTGCSQGRNLLTGRSCPRGNRLIFPHGGDKEAQRTPATSLASHSREGKV